MLMDCNFINNEINIADLFENISSIDQLLHRKYNYQGMEIFTIQKSLNLTLPLINSIFNQNNGINQQIPNAKIVIDSNQMLAIGYTHLMVGFPIILTIYPNVEIIIRNGGKLVLFNDNSLINYGNIIVDNSIVILENNENVTPRLINNGCISMRGSFLLGKGTIFNNGRFSANCNSKISLGKNKIQSSTNNDTESNMEMCNDTDENTGVQKVLNTLDFLIITQG